MYKFLIQINIPIFHHSIIPSGLHETCSTKNGVISISCTISETFNYAWCSDPVYCLGLLGSAFRAIVNRLRFDLLTIS
jgi:hypothetical protein